MKRTPINFTVIEREPTPYKIDLWNTCFLESNFKPLVLFSIKKDNQKKDTGHNYIQHPEIFFQFHVYNGVGIFDFFSSIYKFIHQIFLHKPNYYIICGYSSKLTSFSIIFCILFRMKFFLYVDQLDTSNYLSSKFSLKKGLRKLILSVIQNTSSGLLTCGQMGIQSAIAVNWDKKKLYDFPYTVSVDRIRQQAFVYSDSKIKNLVKDKIVLYFSGRMIKRKGLDLLLKTLSEFKNNFWILLIEGDGPLLDYYKNYAKQLGISEKCHFFGFCQMNLHSFLIFNSNIVVVPSYNDNWGIIVDEGLQLGKIVVSSNKTGAGADRIINSVNGLIFDVLFQKDLLITLTLIFSNYETLRTRFADYNKNNYFYTPNYNLNVLNEIFI